MIYTKCSIALYYNNTVKCSSYYDWQAYLAEDSTRKNKPLVETFNLDRIVTSEILYKFILNSGKIKAEGYGEVRKLERGGICVF